jgi:hypothetical protein
MDLDRLCLKIGGVAVIFGARCGFASKGSVAEMAMCGTSGPMSVTGEKK